jgi:hypothetical protein
MFVTLFAKAERLTINTKSIAVGNVLGNPLLPLVREVHRHVVSDDDAMMSPSIQCKPSLMGVQSFFGTALGSRSCRS